MDEVLDSYALVPIEGLVYKTWGRVQSQGLPSVALPVLGHLAL